MRVVTTAATRTVMKTPREITALAGNTAVITTATKTVTRAVTKSVTISVTEAATSRARARTPTPRRCARWRPGRLSSRSPRCCSERLYIPNLRRRRRPPLPPFPSPLLDRLPPSAPASGSRSPLLDRLSKSQLLTSQTPPPRPHLVLHGNGDRGPERALPAQLRPGDGYMERDDASPRGT